MRAIILDVNGVIVDDEMSHFECFQQALSEARLALSKEEYYGIYLGMDERTCAAALLTRRDGSCAPDVHARIIERKTALVQNHTATCPAALFPRVTGFVERGARTIPAGIRIAGGMREQIVAALLGTFIENAFEVTVSADECAVGKPDPAIYEFTLRQLNARRPRPPLLRCRECLVIEDSPAGIQAGLQAGMLVLAVATTYPASQLTGAHLVLPTLDGIDPGDLARQLF